MSTLRTVTKNTFFYTLSTVLQRSSSIIFFPIFSAYLTTGDYGIQSVVSFITQFISIIGGMQLAVTATRLIHEREDFEERVKEIYGSYFLMIFSANVLLGAIALLIGPWAMAPFLNDIPFYPYMALTLCTLPFVATYTLFKNYLQATHQGKRFVIIDLVYFACNVGLNLLFVAVYHMGVEGIILSTVISSTLFTIYCYFTFLRHTRLRFDMTIVIEGLRFSLPLVPYILIGVMLDWTDKMMLNAKVGKDATGILYISTMLAGFFTVLRESCNQALIPWFYQQYDKLPLEYIRRVIYSAFAGMAIVAVSISWFSYEILVTLSSNPDLIQAYRYSPIIVNTALVVFLAQIFNTAVMYFKVNSRYLFLTTLIALPFNAAISYVLIDHIGIYGASISNFIAMTVMTVICGYLAQRSGFKLGYWYFITIILCSLGLSLLALLPLAFWPMLAMKIVIASGLVLLFYYYVSRHFPVNELIIRRLQPVIAIMRNDKEK